MLSHKQVFIIWTVVWTIITVDGGLVRKKKDVLRQYSNFIIDKTPNAMRISEHEVRFLDKTDHAFDFNDEKIGQENKKPNEKSNEIANDFYSDDDENILRSKRQVSSGEFQDMIGDPSGDDFKETFMTAADTIIDSAKGIADKFAEAFPPTS